VARAKKTSSETPSPDEVVEAAELSTPEAEPAPEPAATEAAAKAARKPRRKSGPDSAEPGETHVETADHALADAAVAETGAEPTDDAVTEPTTPETGEAVAGAGTELSPEDLTEAVSEPLAETPVAAASPQAARFGRRFRGRPGRRRARHRRWRRRTLAVEP
jgi:hypothetical protein